MKSFVLKNIFLLFVIFFSFFPFLVFSQGRIVPCVGPDDCDFNALLQLARNLIDFLVKYISIPLATIAFTYAGFLYVTAGGSEAQVKKAHSIFWKVFWGFVIILSAWLIVSTILNALLNPGYSYLQ